MSKQNPLKEAIQSYLDERAKADELFAVAYKKKIIIKKEFVRRIQISNKAIPAP